MKIAVLGGAGQMGQWMLRHLAVQNHSLVTSNPVQRTDSEETSPLEYTVSPNNETAVGDVDVAIISVPIEETANVVREITPHMRRNAVLCEISSVKLGIIDSLREAASCGLQPLSIHPMFGPGTRSLHKKILMVPVIDLENEYNQTKRIFPEAEIVSVAAEQHDRAMALTLSIPYLINMIIGAMFSGEDIELLERLGGTTFRLQKVLTGAIMAQPVGLHYSLHTQNPLAKSILSTLPSRINDLLTPILDSNAEEFSTSYERITSLMENSMDLNQAYEDMYQILEFLDQRNAQEAEA